jgi:hypothetical protein
VEIGEQDVAGRQALPLDLLRFLDLDDQLGAREHRVGVGRDGRAGLDVEVVAIAGPEARAGLDQHEWPWPTYSRTAVGVRPTRCSPGLISEGTPTRMMISSKWLLTLVYA